jgi:hypothetical protein
VNGPSWRNDGTNTWEFKLALAYNEPWQSNFPGNQAFKEMTKNLGARNRTHLAPEPMLSDLSLNQLSQQNLPGGNKVTGPGVPPIERTLFEKTRSGGFGGGLSERLIFACVWLWGVT